MESKTSVGGGTSVGDSAACNVSGGSAAKPAGKGQPLANSSSQQGTSSQHFVDPAHGTAESSSASPSTSDQHGSGHARGQSGSATKMPSKDQIKQQAAEKMGEMKDSARQSAEQVRKQAGQAASRLKEQGSVMLGQQKSRLVEEVTNISGVVRQAANKLHDEHDNNIATYIDAVADQMDHAAQYLEQKDLSTLLSDATHLARRRPELFAGGMFVAGLTLARFLKASAASPSGRGQSVRRHADGRASMYGTQSGEKGQSTSSAQSPPRAASSANAQAGLGVNSGPAMAGMPTAPTNSPQQTCDSMTSGAPTMTNPTTPRNPR